ncbi:MAG: ferrous iron transport protein A [Erysipelotrichia bacterium]|nr:ferrous iron transport protein A [Erysipelotrichia bacterium]NCC54702.1 ferrous iron transport protein A [Erysipelotrichia bacterium]
MYLIDGFINHSYVIDRIAMETNDVRKLNRLKIEEGSKVTIIRKDRGFPFLIEMEGSRIAFSREVASKVEVIPYD